jgi:hypothetical protein
MKKVKVYLVAPESLWGDDRETKRAAQLEALEALGLKESTSGHVVCTADQVVSLIKAGYCGLYRQGDNVEEAGEFDAGPEVAELFEIVAEKAAAAQGRFNEVCRQTQPGLQLTAVAETTLLEDACTDALQEKLASGWRILAVQPQPDQRRPDYILGRPLMSALRG